MLAKKYNKLVIEKDPTPPPPPEKEPTIKIPQKNKKIVIEKEKEKEKENKKIVIEKEKENKKIVIEKEKEKEKEKQKEKEPTIKKTKKQKKIVIEKESLSPEYDPNMPELEPITPPEKFQKVNIIDTSNENEDLSEMEMEMEDEYDDEDILELENDYDKIKEKCDGDRYSSDCNKFILKKELIERNTFERENEIPYLYPNLNDPNFNIKIAEKKEFNDTKYDGEIHKNIKEYADELAVAEFELSPHQAFVKNFLSSQTPYNSLLLYHGLGSGKTCSAIGVSEEMRDYLKQIGISKRIIIVASENVQDNFKLQLFDERKLKLVDGLWNIKACTGNKLLKEINPMNMKGISREKVISQIKTLINNSYLFLGYGQFANYIIKTIHYDEEDLENVNFKTIEKGEKKQPGEKNKIQVLQDIKITFNKEIIKRLRNEFDNRLIIIDEVHNIRITEDNENKKVAIYLEYLVKAAENVRFLFLSATPMYNNYKEIIWLLNIMNMNDKRAKIDTKNVFDANGDFKKTGNKNTGEELLIRKATGYVSFVRGENPYTFPYRVYPNEFAKETTFPLPGKEGGKKYPEYQMNKKPIEDKDKNRILSLFLNTIGGCNSCGICQACVYKYIIYHLQNKSFSITTKTGLKREMPNFENMESFGYTLLQNPLESLIISYPMDNLKQVLENISKKENSIELNEDDDIFLDPKDLTGKKGLSRMMNFVDEKSPPEKGSFEYKKSTLDKYGKIFSKEQIHNFSSKIKCILDHIVSPSGEVSEGIILIYSQYIDSGLVPMALALEEMGFTRYGQDVTPLFKTKPTEVVDVRTMKPPKNKKDFLPARYSMITGDPRLSPNNDFEVKGLTNDDKQNGNIEGHKIKVVLLSKAGSEGIDLKFIRQVHILEPWYNMNRIEQIIGRAVRNFSHKDLPFEKRNVQIFMYGTLLNDSEEEAADLYVYRVAEYKAIQIGKVSRVLKETAVDCIINSDQTNFTQDKLNSILNKDISQNLSTGITINLKIGDAPYSSACDYMDKCMVETDCKPNKKILENDINEDTYNEKFIMTNSEKILQKIRMLMKESFFYKKNILRDLINTPKKYPDIQIFAALTHLIEDKNESILDKYDRTGYLINIGDYYLFQPSELRDKNIPIYERSVPIDYKHNMVNFQLNQDIVKPVVDMKNISERDEKIIEGKNIIDDLKELYDLAIEFTTGPKVPRGDENWYKYCGIVMKKMLAKKEATMEELLGFLVQHILEFLTFDDKLIIMNYLYSLDNPKKLTFEWFAKRYFQEHIIVEKKIKAIILYDFNVRKTMILNKDNVWEIAEPEDELEIDNSKQGKKALNFNISNYTSPDGIIGFIGYKKNSKNLVFKTKDIFSSRDTGAACFEAGKSKTLTILNKIVGSEKYTKENTKLIKDDDGNVIQETVGEIELCVLQEFLLRKKNLNKDNDNKNMWFLTPDMAIHYKIYTPTLK